MNSRRHAGDPVVGLPVDAFMDGQDVGPTGADDGLDEHINETGMNTQNFCSVCCQAFKSARGLEGKGWGCLNFMSET